MQFSKSSLLSLLALSSLTVAAPAPYDIAAPAPYDVAAPAPNDIAERSTEELQVLEKRFLPFAIVLGKVLVSKLVAKGVTIALNTASEHLEFALNERRQKGTKEWKNFTEAREALMHTLPLDILHNAPAGAKGVICMNQGYTIDADAVHSEAINVKYNWDRYNTDFDCFEVNSGTVRYHGDGGFQNVGAISFLGANHLPLCTYNNGVFTC